MRCASVHSRCRSCWDDALCVLRSTASSASLWNRDQAHPPGLSFFEYQIAKRLPSGSKVRCRSYQIEVSALRALELDGARHHGHLQIDADLPELRRQILADLFVMQHDDGQAQRFASLLADT